MTKNDFTIFYPNINLLFHADKCRQTRAFHRFYSKLIWVISLSDEFSPVFPWFDKIFLFRFPPKPFCL